jgi:hypothetical protein
MDEAFPVVEEWARLRPLPAVEAWTIGGGWSERGDYISRTEPPVEIKYFVPTEGNAPGVIAVEVTECGDGQVFETFEAQVRRDGSPAEHHARARAALAAKLAEAGTRCGWAPDKAVRLAQGFEEAEARAEAERHPATSD